MSTSRRAFLSFLSGGTLAGLPGKVVSAEPRLEVLGRKTLRCAEQLSAVAFSEDEEDRILPNAARFREYYKALRSVELSIELEPAFSFHPPLPAHASSARATPNAVLPLSKPSEPAAPYRIADLALTSVARIAPLIEARLVSSVELTRMYLDRLKRADAALKCVVTFTEDLGLAQAEIADREIRSGLYRGPLHGIPWGVKDLFATKGIRTTWGAAPYHDQMIDVDATAIERLRAAGAVLIAKLATGELAGNDLWFGGKTRNPWRPERGSGGSSAGPAAATAAGLVSFSVGTDTGGSIIQPANTCGAVGMRPTYGRISRYGVMPLRWTMDKVGPICRSVEDCALVFNSLYGPDGRDQTVADLPFSWDPSAAVSGMRIGFVRQEFEQPRLDADAEALRSWPERKKVLGEALEVFGNAGARLEPITLPDLPVAAAERILSAESGAVFDDFVRGGAVKQLAGRGPNERANQLRTSRFIPAVEYIQAQRLRRLLMRDMEVLLTQYDAFLSPPDSRSVLMTSMTGHPAIVLKAGFVDELPQGILITGRLFDEARLLRVALAYEEATRWHTMHPPLAATL